MKRSWLIGLAVILVLLLIGFILKDKLFAKQGMAYLSVSTNQKAAVYIDGDKVGLTPLFKDNLQAKEHTVKLIPEAGDLVSWESKVNFTPNLLTTINRNFASNESASAGEVIWLEKIGSKDKSSINVVSNPDRSVFKIDGEPKGFTPKPIDDLSPGSYQVAISSTGFEERTVTAKTIAGYQMIINVQLAQITEGIAQVTPSPEATPAGGKITPSLKPTPIISGKITPSPKATPKLTATVTAIEKPYVTIKETPTGWLRVRTAPDGQIIKDDNDNEVHLKPGETYPYLNEEKNGWYKIEYEADKEGWISKVYADLTE
jgi:hypothetical protein